MSLWKRQIENSIPALKNPNISCRCVTFCLWHANRQLFQNICVFFLFPCPHNGIKSSCVNLIRGFLLSVFCQSIAIPTYKNSAIAPPIRPLNLRRTADLFLPVENELKKNWQEEEVASSSVTVSHKGHHLFIKPLREWYYQWEWLNWRSHTGPHLLLSWLEGGVPTDSNCSLSLKWGTKAIHWAIVRDIKCMFAC